MDYRLMPVLLVIFLDGCWRCCDDLNVHPRPSLCRSSTGPPRLIKPKRHLEVSKQAVYIRLFLFSKIDQNRSQYDIVWPKIWWSKLALLVTFDHGHQRPRLPCQVVQHHRDGRVLVETFKGGDPIKKSPLIWCGILPSGNLLHSYWKWPFIVDLPIKNGDFPYSYVSSPEGTVHLEILCFSNTIKFGTQEKMSKSKMWFEHIV